MQRKYMVKRNQDNEHQHKLLVDLLKKENDRKVKLTEKVPVNRKSQTIIDKYPDPKYKTPQVCGPGRYDWESAKDLYSSNNSNKNVISFALQDKTDHRSLDSLKGLRKHQNFNSRTSNPYMSISTNPYTSLKLKSTF